MVSTRAVPIAHVREAINSPSEAVFSQTMMNTFCWKCNLKTGTLCCGVFSLVTRYLLCLQLKLNILLLIGYLNIRYYNKWSNQYWIPPALHFGAKFNVWRSAYFRSVSVLYSWSFKGWYFLVFIKILFVSLLLSKRNTDTVCYHGWLWPLLLL